MTESMREAFESAKQALKELADIAEDHPGIPPGVGDMEAEVLEFMEECVSAISQPQQWIKCSDRLPGPEDSDCYGHVWACGSANSNYPTIRPWDCAFGFKYWMPTHLKHPEPPKE